MDTIFKRDEDRLEYYKLKMRDTDKELLTYIRRLEEQRTAVEEDITLLLREQDKRNAIQALQETIADTLDTFSQERMHYLQLWHSNDDIRILNATQERNIYDILSSANQSTVQTQSITSPQTESRVLKEVKGKRMNENSVISSSLGMPSFLQGKDKKNGSKGGNSGDNVTRANKSKSNKNSVSSIVSPNEGKVVDKQ